MALAPALVAHLQAGCEASIRASGRRSSRHQPPGCEAKLVSAVARRIQNRLAQRSVRPAGAAWLKPRLEAALITTGRCVVSAAATGERVILRLDNSSERRVDHVLLATGYRVNISRYPFLTSKLLASIRQVNGFPELDIGFESSVPGLHFLGAPAAWSFGPLMRFVEIGRASCRERV